MQSTGGESKVDEVKNWDVFKNDIGVVQLYMYMYMLHVGAQRPRLVVSSHRPRAGRLGHCDQADLVIATRLTLAVVNYFAVRQFESVT